MRIILGALLAALLPAETEEIRAVWVTRFDYASAKEVRSILANCASLGFNTVLFQVRGQGDAYYRSSHEPWSERLGGADPGFDPLETACQESRRLGLSLHAWINVFPAWKGKVPPRDKQHPAIRHPEWIVVGRDGKRQAWNDQYVCFNPCLPAVREHITSVVREIASKYDVDGVHLDYVRFLEGDWSYDRATLALFGGRPEARPTAWEEFRRDAVTETVKSIRAVVKESRPGAILSSAVYPTAESRRRVLQDAERWVSEGLVDWVFPMTYNDRDEEHRAEVEEAYRLFRKEDGSPAPCFPGVGVYRHKSADQTLRQMRMCRSGYGLFAYASLFPTADDTQKDQEPLRRARREALRKPAGR